MTGEMTDRLRPERYRSYLLLVAQMSLWRLGPVAHKVGRSDVVQEVLLQAHIARDQFRGTSEAELEGWLRKILKNKLTDAVRHFARQKRDAARERSIHDAVDESAGRFENVAADQTSPSQYAGRRERALRVAEAMEALPEDQRNAVELHHLHGYSVSEIASQMGRGKPSVAGLLRRGLGGNWARSSASSTSLSGWASVVCGGKPSAYGEAVGRCPHLIAWPKSSFSHPSSRSNTAFHEGSLPRPADGVPFFESHLPARFVSPRLSSLSLEAEISSERRKSSWVCSTNRAQKDQAELIPKRPAKSARR